MIKHIVMWKVRETSGGSKEENARAIKAKLDGLKGKIPGMLHIEGGIDFNRSEVACDVVVYSEFESRAALDAYQRHPLHQEIVPFIRERDAGRHVVDYEV